MCTYIYKHFDKSVYPVTNDDENANDENDVSETRASVCDYFPVIGRLNRDCPIGAVIPEKPSLCMISKR